MADKDLNLDNLENLDQDINLDDVSLENMETVQPVENMETVQPMENMETVQPVENMETVQPMENMETDLFNLGIMEKGIKRNKDEQESNEVVNFSYTTPKEKKKKEKRINYKKISNIFIGLIFLFLILIVGLFFYTKYLNLSVKTKQTNEDKNYITKVRDTLSKINKYIPIYPAADYENKINTIEDIKRVIASDKIGYIDKKYLLGEKTNKLISDLLEQKSNLVVSKKNITKYAYSPKEIGDIIGGETTISSIEDSLFALETIKFNSAINVFIYLDSFINDLSKRIKIPTKDIKEKMLAILKNGETDINVYVKKCYQNPFEPKYDCNVIGDYDLYNDIINKASNSQVDRVFFKELINFIDQKLERTSLPSFSIVFQAFDKNNDNISFTIDINTLRQDELELARSGYLDPTIFIMKELINNLKRSKYVIGSNIKIDSLNVREKKIKIGITEIMVNTLSKQFVLPIQKLAEREIYDVVSIE